MNTMKDAKDHSQTRIKTKILRKPNWLNVQNVCHFNTFHGNRKFLIDWEINFDKLFQKFRFMLVYLCQKRFFV